MALIPTNQSPDKKKAAEEDVLLREVDDAVRQDQFSNAARKYGIPAGIVLFVALASLLGYVIYDGQREAELEKQSEALISALDNIEAGNFDTGSAVLDPVVAEGEDGTATVAQLMQAGIALETDKPERAAEIYNEIADNAQAPAALRDLALIRSVAVQYDRMQPADVVSRLKPLAVPGNAYFGSAGELVAMAYLDQDKPGEAGALFAQISKDENVPEGLRSRTRQMAGLLGVDAIEDVDELLEEQAGPEAAGAVPAQ